MKGEHGVVWGSIWGPVFKSIASHGIFGKCLKSLLERELEGSLPSSLLPVPWLRSGHCPPNETPLWCLEDPYSMKEKGGGCSSSPRMGRGGFREAGKGSWSIQRGESRV